MNQPLNDLETTLATATAELAAAGAQAVVLFGSMARGEASPHSDIDLLALGEGPARYERRDGRLLVASWSTVEAVRRSFDDPAAVGSIIPGWRVGRILHDPAGVAAQLQQEAAAWTWERVGSAACDAWVAREIAGLAEEVHKLVGALEQDRLLMAAVQRSVLALRLAGIMAVQRRLLYGSENHLWNLIAAELGEPWASAQACALGLGGDPLDMTCRAALHLYALAAQEAITAFDDQQRPIIAHACALAGYIGEARATS